MYYSTDYESPLGEMLIVSDGEAICGVWFYGQKHFKSTVIGKTIHDDGLSIFKKAKQKQFMMMACLFLKRQNNGLKIILMVKIHKLISS